MKDRTKKGYISIPNIISLSRRFCIANAIRAAKADPRYPDIIEAGRDRSIPKGSAIAASINTIGIRP